MAFEKQLPEWNDIGVEPPQSKKDTGWEEKEKPPAQWFNWFQNRTYEALKELQEKSALKSDLENVEVPVTSVNNKTGDVNLTADEIPVENVNFTSANINGALTELFTNVSNGKSLIGGAITDVDPDVTVPAEPTFQQLRNAILDISTGYLESIIAGDGVIYSNPNLNSVDSLNFTKVNEVEVNFDGSCRVGFTLYKSGGTGSAGGQIHINGVPAGTERSTNVTSTNGVTYWEDFNVSKGDFIQLFIKVNASNVDWALSKDFSLSIDGSELISEKI